MTSEPQTLVVSITRERVRNANSRPHPRPVSLNLWGRAQLAVFEQDLQGMLMRAKV